MDAEPSFATQMMVADPSLKKLRMKVWAVQRRDLLATFSFSWGGKGGGAQAPYAPRRTRRPAPNRLPPAAGPASFISRCPNEHTYTDLRSAPGPMGFDTGESPLEQMEHKSQPMLAMERCRKAATPSAVRRCTFIDRTRSEACRR